MRIKIIGAHFFQQRIFIPHSCQPARDIGIRHRVFAAVERFAGYLAGNKFHVISHFYIIAGGDKSG